MATRFFRGHPLDGQGFAGRKAAAVGEFPKELDDFQAMIFAKLALQKYEIRQLAEQPLAIRHGSKNQGSSWNTPASSTARIQLIERKLLKPAGRVALHVV